MDFKGLLLFMVLSFSLNKRAVSQANGDIRLVSGNFGSEKVVEIYYNGLWIKAKSNFEEQSIIACRITCRQLGFYDCDYNHIISINSSVSSTALLVNCSIDIFSRDNPHILQCDHHLVYNTSNSEYKDLAVECDVERRDFHYDTQIRLLYGEFRSSGYVEINLNHGWGPVCNMKAAEADTACRQLGFTNAVSYKDTKGYSDYSNNWDKLDNFSCTDNGTISYDCLNKCFDYPKCQTLTSCEDLHTFINCTFDDQNSDTTFGDHRKCNKNGGRPIPDFPTYWPIPPPYYPHSADVNTGTIVLATVVPFAAAIIIFVIIMSLYWAFSKRRQYQSI